jgi:hypothetical protein
MNGREPLHHFIYSQLSVHWHHSKCVRVVGKGGMGNGESDWRRGGNGNSHGGGRGHSEHATRLQSVLAEKGSKNLPTKFPIVLPWSSVRNVVDIHSILVFRSAFAHALIEIEQEESALNGGKLEATETQVDLHRVGPGCSTEYNGVGSR